MKTKKNEDKWEHNPLEYEDFGTPALYIWSILIVIVAFVLLVIFGLIVGGGIALASGILK